METKHTPTPWFLHADSDLSGEIYFKHDNGKEYEIARAATGYGNDKGANVAFIVRAVNAHDALVGALEYARRFVKDADMDFIDAALKLAKGE